jgi:transposase
VDKAFQAFFRRVKAGQTPGYPRSTSRNRYGSLTDPQSGFGIDVGLSTFAYLSTGEQIENPRFFREEEHALTRAQRRLSKAELGNTEHAERRKVVARVQPAYTSQTCSGCGHQQELLLSVRVYECLHCGLVMDRDHNASVNILQKAVGRHSASFQKPPALRAVGSRHFWASAST